jgi:hypothetical protein
MKNFLKGLALGMLILVVGTVYAASVGGYFSTSADGKTMTVADGGNIVVAGTLTLDSATISGSASALCGSTSFVSDAASIDVVTASTVIATGASVDVVTANTVTSAGLDINGDADISGTCNADTLDVDGPADFAMTLVADTLTVDLDADVAGTLNADTLDVDGDADFAKTLTGDTVVIRLGLTYKDATGAPLLSLKNDLIAAGVATGTTTGLVDASTVVLPAGMLDATEAIDIDCYGTVTGTNGDKEVYLYAGNTVAGQLTSQVASAGAFKAEFTLAEYTDAAHQATVGSLLLPGGTVDNFQAAINPTTVNMAVQKTLTVKIKTPDSTADELTLYACFWTFRP